LHYYHYCIVCRSHTSHDWMFCKWSKANVYINLKLVYNYMLYITLDSVIDTIIIMILLDQREYCRNESDPFNKYNIMFPLIIESTNKMMLNLTSSKCS
jgi:ribosomal protein L44E